MNKEALRHYVEGPLKQLKEIDGSDTLPIQEIWIKECDYHQWERRHEQSGWKPFHQSQGFGGHEYHCLLRCEVIVPEQWKGKTVRLRVQTGANDIWNNNNPQFLLFLNDELSCGLDVRHTEADLPDAEQVSIVLYAYTNTQKPDVFLSLEVYAVNLEREALLYDLELAYETALTLEEFSEAYLLLSEAVIKTVQSVDFSSMKALQDEGMLSMARSIMKQHLARYQDANRMQLSLTGHSHIDMAWLWILEQTREKSLRSYATVLSLMERYPSYIFSSSQMQLLEFVKTDYPSLFNRIKERVLEGRWEVEGAMWVESDTILTSGESLVRQIFWGKRWVRDEFGMDQNVLWLPDCFGFPATLPQIMKGTNLSYFVTTKMGWNETDRMPHDLFHWKGLDGSQVLAYFVSSKDYESIASYPKRGGNETTYNGVLSPSQLLGTWQRFSDKECTDTLMYLYGYGDGGGGPTKEMLEREKRLREGYPGLPKVHSGTVKAYLQEMDKKAEVSASWFGELYLEYHRGTYTTMTQVKQLNRHCEQSAMQAEFFLSLLYLYTKQDYPHASFEQAWKQLLLNQFHDILPGSALKEVYELTLLQQRDSLDTFTRHAENAMHQLSSLIARSDSDVVVFNTLGHQRSGLCRIEGCSAAGAYDEKGLPLPSFHDGKNLYFHCTAVPAKGWKRFVLSAYKPPQEKPFTWNHCTLESPHYTAVFTQNGRFSRLYDKSSGYEVLAPGREGNVLMLACDYPKDYDAWNIGKQGKDMYYEVAGEAQYTVVANNALFFTLEWQLSFGSSSFTQRATFHTHEKRIDFTLVADYHEDHLMLRSLFTVDVHAPRASYDIAYGVCERTTHTNTSWDVAQFEVPAHKWVDLSDESYGVTLLSKQSYGYSAKDNTISISLLRSPTYPNKIADRGMHTLHYALYPHKGRYQGAKVIEEGYHLHQPLLAVKASQAKAMLPPVASVVSCPDENLVIETVKKSEDRDSLLIRILQLNGKRVTSSIRTELPIKEAYQCNLLEERLQKISWNDEGVAVRLRPHEIQTIELIFER
jgi:alpha-mannosidase